MSFSSVWKVALCFSSELRNICTPRKVILTKEHLEYFQNSQTHKDIVSYIETLNEAVVGVQLTDQCTESPGVRAIVGMFDEVEKIAKATPPVDNKASRFGNPAFRTFYDKVAEAAPSLHTKLPGLAQEAIPELAVYFGESWGNRARIAYGSGMELNFLCWLICLERLGVVQESDHVALVIRVLWRYLQAMRVLQSTYWLEPAGSHGVWGLDDYHFLPFCLSLRNCEYIKPKAIHDSEIVDEYAKHYLYFACIKFINQVKTASLRWHSPMLDDISAMRYNRVFYPTHVLTARLPVGKDVGQVVLGKLPVMQHFLFGSILSWDGPMPPPRSEVEEDDAHLGYAHAHPDLGGAGQREVGWGDCCGIPVPSVFASAVAEKSKASGGRREAVRTGIRAVPFADLSNFLFYMNADIIVSTKFAMVYLV
ncbi:Phosphotyrosyl phosphatase activator [Laetiporus sulphureus 93-53]|uniref:Serine/threonine-protein phosphatase 2A activator n=1 Tax=Laetiporus sulphureus 93-53 TaxID=1314785 RepID=A0A165ARN7_9APHY|nr:Phosphotyrosyl phosphatase activator [Laetiporus sulphureus 93-53]KZS99527.1 Phosphotyrosyl phosphatase activator [Laetiporus sulphureus 93-53]